MHRRQTAVNIADGRCVRRYGFNFQWMYIWQPGARPMPVQEKALDWLEALGFDFVRVPVDYRFWTKDFDYRHPDERTLRSLDQYLRECRARRLHLSLNLHRAPGYCINNNHLEKHNLWLDKPAQDGFVFLWETFARRYKGVPADALSFDLLNEPPEVGQYGMTRENHAGLIRRTVAAIRAIDPERDIVIDGLGGGHLAMPELADIGVIHSGRGYQPMPISHYRACWWPDQTTAPAPVYPDLDWEGRKWNYESLREFYEPWRDIERQGVAVHIGEAGCFNATPNDVALRWFKDLFQIFRECRWGYALWMFEGPFGIVEHGRAGARYENVHGYRVDRALLELMLASRV